MMIAGCNPTPVAPEIVSDGPRVWLDAPLNNSTLPLAPLEIVSHSNDPLRVTQIELSVNGSPLRTDPNPDAAQSLVTMRQQWSPPAPGNYTLLVRAQNSASVWSEYAQSLVVIGGTTGGTIKGAVYADLNVDGDTNDASEGVLDDVTVTLTGCASKSMQTDEGLFEFTGLPAGLCYVSVTKPGWKFSSTFPTGIDYPAKVVSDPSKPSGFSIMMTPEVAKIEVPPPVVVAPAGRTPIPPTTVTFLADPSRITSGQCATIRWQVTNASKVFLDDVQVELSGTKRDCPKQNTTHVLRLVTLDNQTATRTLSISVTQPPVVNTGCTGSPSISSFGASATSITKGSSTTLNWGTISNVDSVEIDQGIGKLTIANKTVAASSKTVTPAQTTTYTLTARCGTNAVTRQVAVTVNVPAAPKCSGTPSIASFTSSAASMSPGQSVTLSWGAVTNADSVEIDPGIGGVATPGSRQVSPSQTTTYTLTAKCGSSVATRQVKITVISAVVAPPKCSGNPTISSFTASPVNITSGKTATLSWGTVSNADSIEIDQGIGKVSAPGSRSVSPKTTTTYKLTAKCGSNTVTRTATVGVVLTIPGGFNNK
jgi:hypothetical protein